MTVLAVGLSVLALPVATALAFGLSWIGLRLGHRIRVDRVSGRDEQWLASQGRDD